MPALLEAITKSLNAVMYSTDGIYINSFFKILEQILEPTVRLFMSLHTFVLESMHVRMHLL